MSVVLTTLTRWLLAIPPAALPRDGVTFGQQIGEPTPIEGHPGAVAFTVTVRLPRRPGIDEVRLAPEGLTRDGRRCDGADGYPRYRIQVVSNSPPGAEA